MNSISLKSGLSAIAIVVGSSVASVAMAQSASLDSEAIIVTGSRIQGVAPVGSNLVSLGQDALVSMAATSASEFLNTVPSLSMSNKTPQGQSSYSYYAPEIHQIAGSGSNATLALIDGLRMPGGGLQYAQADPNIIPTSALQRLEVLADGASAIYGSDAVAGVVNFITRTTYDGAQINGRAGFGRNYQSFDANGIWGTTWGTGGVYVAGQFLKQARITNNKRAFLSRGDYRDLGGSNTNTFLCSPATIRNGSTNYISASSAETVLNNQAKYGFCNNSVYGTAIPGVQREGVLVVLNQDFGDRVKFTGKVVFNHLTHFADGGPGTLSAAMTFGEGSGRGTQINPYFMAPPGSGFTSEQVNWVALNPSGDYGTNNYENTTFYVTGVVEAKIAGDWTTTLSTALARSNSFQRQFNTFSNVKALLYLNGSPTLGGNRNVVLSPTDTALISRELTTANALDVWMPLGGNRTSAETWKDIYSLRTNNEHQNDMSQIKLEAQGSLFDLPAGAARMALGGEHMFITQDVYGITPNSTGTGYNNFIMNLGPRKVDSAYVEFYLPFVSEDMDVPGVQALDVSVSGRYDHYSDWGSTKNPKFAANWQINDSIKIRGNWTTSFVAPPLNQIGDPSQGYLRGATGTGGSAVFDAPVSIYPNLVNLPGCEGLTAGQVCRIGANTGREGLDRSLGAGFGGVKPQKGRTWSVGVDLTPEFMPGFGANITLWTTKYLGGVNSPAQPLIINSAQLADRLFVCADTPGQACSADQIRQFTNVDNGATTAPVLPSPVYFLINRDVTNALNLNAQGIDAQFMYQIQTANTGTFKVGGNMTYYTRMKQSAPGGEWFSILNTSGYNSQFPSIQTRGRGQLGWTDEAIAVDLFANYTGSYRNWIQTSVDPVKLGTNGNPVGGGDKVRSDLTFDLHAAYNFSVGFVNSGQLYVDVKNLFDRDPPFYNGNTTGAGVGAWGYNGFVSNLLGRVVSVGFRTEM